MPDARGATDIDQPAPEAYRCPDCNSALVPFAAAWTCHYCQLTQLLGRCRGCGGRQWMIAGQLPNGWAQVSAAGTYALVCSAVCMTTVATDWGARGLVAPHPAPPPTPAAGPPPAAGV